MGNLPGGDGGKRNGDRAAVCIDATAVSTQLIGISPSAVSICSRIAGPAFLIISLALRLPPTSQPRGKSASIAATGIPCLASIPLAFNPARRWSRRDLSLRGRPRRRFGFASDAALSHATGFLPWLGPDRGVVTGDVANQSIHVRVLDQRLVQP